MRIGWQTAVLSGRADGPMNKEQECWMDALITAIAKVNDISILSRDKRLAQLLAGEADFSPYA
jgi:hypothetical protein